jgi:YHS domain-containing protein
MFVDVEIETKVPEGLSIPADAVLDSGMRKIVYVETAEGVFEPHPVQISGAYGDRVIVVGGIKQGDRIVVSGNFLLDSESRMRASSQPVSNSDTALLLAAADSGVKPGHSTTLQSDNLRDPVCGMTLKPGEVAFKETYQGKTFNFCSDSCRKKFTADPGKYAATKAAIASIVADQAAHKND